MTGLTINLSFKDLFTEEHVGGEDGYVEIGLADALKSALLQEARGEIRKMVDGKVQQLLQETFLERFDLIIGAMADKYFETFQESPEFKNSYKTTTIYELLKSKFDRVDFDGKTTTEVKRLAELHTAEIKKTFDQRYAAGVVEGLNKHGLLNNKAANLLLEKAE